MSLNVKRGAFAILITTVLAFGVAMEANAQVDVFTDTFDAAPSNGAMRVLSPDNSATGGQFPSNGDDVFGIVDRDVDSDFGIILPERTDLFLGFADTDNNDNTEGDVSVTWTVSAAGLTDLSLSFEIAAMGDFEPSDLLTVTASFDGGAEETIFTNDNPNEGTFVYTLDDGSTVPLDDPFVIGGQFVVNEFQTFNFPISGSGSELTLTLNYNTNGAGEVLAIDNVSVSSGAETDALKGDVDMDGDVDFDDIAPFIAVLQAGVFQAEADTDCNGEVDFGDIAPFIAILQSQ